MKEHGLRYREDPQARADVCDYIRDEVRWMDFASVVEWYRTFVPRLTRPEIAYLACNDRFFLTTALLNRPDALHAWLYDRCREVEMDPDDHLDLWARYHYKSTFITFAGIIQEIIRDPEVTFGIFSATKAIARPFLAQIKEELENNDRLKEIFPDVLYTDPASESPSWSVTSGITVRRRSNPKECTVEAYGLETGMPTGKHFKVLVYDDLVTEDLVGTPERIAKITRRWELSDNLGVGPGTRKWHAGTRYHYADTYGQIIKRGILRVRLYPATVDGTMTGQPVFMTPEHWEQVKTTQVSTAPAQMLQNPLAGSEITFPVKYFRGFEIRPGTVNIAIMGDPSKGRSATSDRTAIAVVAIDAQGNRFLVDGFCHRMTLSQRWNALKWLWTKWQKAPGVQNVKVGWEQYGLATDIEYFKEQGQREGVFFPIAELNWVREGNQSKKDRVERLQPDHQNGRLWIPLNVWDATTKQASLWTHNADQSDILYLPKRGRTGIEQSFIENGMQWRVQPAIVQKTGDGQIYDLTVALIEEMRLFPFAAHDDLVDAVSRLYDLEVLPPSPSEADKVAKLNAALQE